MVKKANGAGTEPQEPQDGGKPDQEATEVEFVSVDQQLDNGASKSTALVPVKPPPEKDPATGRFLPGNNGGPGRKLGSKVKLAEDFIADFHAAWLKGGRKALRHMVKNDQSAFVRAAIQLMPKDVLVDARGAGIVVIKLSDEDLAL